MENVSIEPLASFWTRFRPWAQSAERQTKIVAEVERALGKLALAEAPQDPRRKANFCWMAHEARGENVLASVWLCVAAMHSRFAATILSARLAAFSLEQAKRSKNLLYRSAKATRLGSPTIQAIEMEIDRHRDDVDANTAAFGVPWPKWRTQGREIEDVPIEPPDTASHVPVLRGKIRYSGDRETNLRLREFESLEKPVRRVLVDPNWRNEIEVARWLEPVAKQIERRLVAFRNKPLRLPPTLIVGPPGCGKSRLVADIAFALDAPLLPLSFAGQSDARALLGTARGWGSSSCSIVVDTMMRHRVANPIVFVDEVEKSYGSPNGDPLTALLPLLEPETARVFHDPFLQLEVDLSHVLWFAGANSLRGIPPAVLSRFSVIEVEAPDGRDWPFVREVFVGELEAAYGLPPNGLPPIDPEVDKMLATLLDRRRDLRVVRRTFEQVVGAALEEHACLPN
jgi:hypothetical protein